ncbi:MAG: carboxypeptidase regulatory-like domain-containing protein, partial [Acidobacteria bacterium]|nr:carboxypeptidase regulatory-like domain-containing protein [Acidobacteriota bacterium]
MMRFFSPFVLALFFGTLCWAQSLTVRGRVSDSSGAALGSASVRAYQEERLIVEIRSDEKGEFSLSAPAGEYRVEITAAGFTPFREIV